MRKKQEDIQPVMPRDTYQTGVTEPPKKWGGLVAGLLMAIIFLCGIVTALSAMNIRLFQQMSSRESSRSMTFTRHEAISTAAYDELWGQPEETFWEQGFAGRRLDPVYCNYYGLPAGLYISQVDTNSRLGKLGLQPGDVLVQVNDTSVTDIESAKSALEGLQEGTLILYRAGQQIIIEF